MPLFTSAAGFQITGGTFIDNAGDMNIHTTQLMPGQNADALEFLEEDSSHEWLGVERNDRGIGGVRVRPYDASSRPQILRRP
ncbi:hypothetical protein B0H13DRAFT_2264440 [Mycena leptocephala]|nr:hypothetical protein B0H13DRAFT_2264440 [Mycena leptocephala]